MPLNTRNIILRPHPDWCAIDIRDTKRTRRQLQAQRLFWKAGLTVHGEIFMAQMNINQSISIKTERSPNKTHWYLTRTSESSCLRYSIYFVLLFTIWSSRSSTEIWHLNSNGYSFQKFLFSINEKIVGFMFRAWLLWL